jgi:CheY-like chemotaxis protein/HPt (histidine-containing phosphotransfer) domain-containing protein
MLSSRDQRGDGRALEEAGFDAFFTKPVKRNVLRRMLVRLFDAPAEAVCAAPTQGSEQSSVDGQPVRVLVAEDNPTNQKVALSMLKRLGHRADAVANGREALKALQLIPYDLVLMDVQMPEMDGLEATRRFRALEAGTGRRLPIIAMTAHASTTDRDRCLSAGMDDFVTKPVQRETLGKTIAAVLARSSASMPDATGGMAPAAQHAPPNRAAPTQVAATQPPPTEAEATSMTSEEEGNAGFTVAMMVERLDNDEEIAREIAGIFVESSEGLFAELADAIPKGDLEAVRTRAHSIKGSAGNIGATALYDLATAMEFAGRDGKLDEAERLLPKLRANLDEVNAVLTNWS